MDGICDDLWADFVLAGSGFPKASYDFFEPSSWLAVEMVSKVPGYACCLLMWAHVRWFELHESETTLQNHCILLRTGVSLRAARPWMFGKLYQQTQRTACCKWRDPSAEELCDFHGASSKYNFSVWVPLNISISLCQMKSCLAEFWQPFCRTAWLLNGAWTSPVLPLTWLFSASLVSQQSRCSSF